MMEAFWLLFALTIKHFICDFPLQMFPYQYLNKGSYGHPGGLVHAGIHTIGTMIALMLFIPASPLCPILAVADGVIHYHIDYAKVNICKAYDWQPTNSEYYWITLGVDQLLHYLTYFVMVFIIIK